MYVQIKNKRYQLLNANRKKQLLTKRRKKKTLEDKLYNSIVKFLNKISK